jgi:FkbM family methyltransferase
MLISFEDVQKLLLTKNINIIGCFHIGAHNCEELDVYNRLGVVKENIVWIDAIPSKVVEATDRGIPNVYNAVITDKDDEDIVFNISNNVQSSSVLELGTHSREHPTIVFVDKINAKSITIDTFFERNNIDASKYDFWNFDIQGAELMALKGATKSIQYAKALYLEVNENELYINCGRMKEIDEFLLNYNFKRVITNMTPFGWGDALYILEDEVSQESEEKEVSQESEEKEVSQESEEKE